MVRRQKRLDYINISTVLIIFGFLLRLFYILYTNVGTRQNDVGSFFDSNDFGHADYIKFFSENLSLPNDFQYQFYHPPLHHIISGLFLRLNLFIGIKFEHAIENLQILTLFYSSACMLISREIFKKLNLNQTSSNFALAIICFHPTFIIMSGNINNDILCVSLMLISIFTMLCWCESPSFGKITILALLVGLSVMTKFSAILLIPSIGIVFLVKLLKDKTLLKQFILFGVIVLPMSLWWQLHCILNFNIPFGYVLELSKESGQYLGQFSLFERFFDIQDMFKSVFLVPLEHNFFIALLKTSLFGESIFFETNMNNVSYVLCVLLFIVNLFIVLGSIWGFYLFLNTNKSTVSSYKKIFISFLFITMFLSYGIFCFRYPQVCSQNIRYIVPNIVLGSIFIGFLMESHIPKKIKQFFSLCIGTFCILSCVLFIRIYFYC